MEQFNLLQFLVLSCQVPIPNLQEVLVTDPELCEADQRYLLFPSQLLLLSTKSFLFITWSFQASLELGTFFLVQWVPN